MKTLTESAKISLNDRNLHKYFVLMKPKNGHILTFSVKMQISAIFDPVFLKDRKDVLL